MARISGVDLPNDKRVVIALTYIHGIGRSLAKSIVEKAQIDENARVKDLSNEELGKVRTIISDYTVEGALRAEVSMNIKRLMDIGSYRGLRHRRNMPVRGQRTHTNASTRRKKKRSVGAKKKQKS